MGPVVTSTQLEILKQDKSALEKQIVELAQKGVFDASHYSWVTAQKTDRTFFIQVAKRAGLHQLVVDLYLEESKFNKARKYLRKCHQHNQETYNAEILLIRYLSTVRLYREEKWKTVRVPNRILIRDHMNLTCGSSPDTLNQVEAATRKVVTDDHTFKELRGYLYPDP